MATPEDVRRLAALSRLAVSDAELPAFVSEFESVLAYVGKLESLDLGVAATPHVPELRNVFREDGLPHEKGMWTQKLVAQFPESQENYLSVKQIITHD